MLTWVIQISLISIIFIFLVHHLFCYLKNILTIPKIKDLVTLPSKKYDNIFSIISKQTNYHDINNENEHITYTEIDLLPNANINTKINTNTNTNINISMKDELKSFFKSQINNKDSEKKIDFSDKNIDFFNTYSTEENFSYL